jgi:uncharacterized protein
MMKARMAAVLLVLLAGGAWAAPEGAAGTDRGVFEVPELKRVEITDQFFAPRREALGRVTLMSQWAQLGKHHDVDNFRVAAGELTGAHQGMMFNDSDVYKWLEAASYVLAKHPDSPAAAPVAELTRLIPEAQMPDGYLDTYYRIFAPDHRWRELDLNHELYCSGHFIEAACARSETSGDRRLLAAAERLGDCIAAEFGPGKNEGVPGHEEVELALIRLYRVTGNPAYLDTAAFFIDRRGRDPHYKRELLRDVGGAAKVSQAARKLRALDPVKPDQERVDVGMIFKPSALLRAIADISSGRYFQMDRPLAEQTVAVGHSVRAMYFCTGAADLCLERDDPGLRSALTSIWDRTITRRTYVTGGMGSLPIIEGFGRDYELPNRAYSETCAAIASFFFSHRMLRLTGEAKYADQMERALDNAILSGISLDGTKYFYQNPLTAAGKTQRQDWYKVACCPPNIARLLASLERYLYGEGKDAWVHQYVSGTADLELAAGKVRLTVASGLPWAGTVKVRVAPERPARFVLRLRVPGWSGASRVRVVGDAQEYRPQPGTYLALDREWKPGDEVELVFDLAPRLLPSPPEVKEDRGKVAILAGPLVYCLEDRDNPGINVHRVELDPQAPLAAEYRGDLLGGLAVVKARARDGRELVAVPYYAWDNRGPSHMEVWIKEAK